MNSKYRQVITKLASMRLAVNYILKNRFTKTAAEMPLYGSPYPETKMPGFDGILNSGQKMPQSYRPEQEALSLPNFQGIPKPNASPSKITNYNNKALVYNVLNSLNYKDYGNPDIQATSDWKVGPGDHDTMDWWHVTKDEDGINVDIDDYLRHGEASKPQRPKQQAYYDPKTDLMSFLLTKGMPKSAPFTYNFNIEPGDEWGVSVTSQFNPIKPAILHVPKKPRFLSSSGHEIGHNIYDNRPYMFENNNRQNFVRDVILEHPTMISDEFGATSVQQAAMRKALEARPDLYDRYLRQASQDLVPAFGTYMRKLPMAVSESLSTAGGLYNTFKGLKQRAGRTRSGMHNNFIDGYGTTLDSTAPIGEAILPFSDTIGDVSSRAARKLEKNKQYMKDDNDLFNELQNFATTYYGYKPRSIEQNNTGKKPNLWESGLNASPEVRQSMLDMFDALYKYEPRYRRWLHGWNKNLNNEPDVLYSLPEDRWNEILNNNTYTQ